MPLVQEPRQYANVQATDPRGARSGVVGLGLVLALAVILRLWGLAFGLPHTLARPDEDATVAIALTFFRRSWNPGFFDWPSLFMYASTAAFVVYFQIGRLIGWFPYEVTFLVEASKHPAPLRLITRGLSAAAGVFTVATVHAIGLHLFDRTTALIGAFFLAGAALHVRDSHFGVTDVAATWLVTLSFLYTVKFAQRRRRGDLIRSALLAGAAASTKYNAGLIVLPAVFAILAGSAEAPERWRVRIGQVAFYVAIAMAAFFAGTPYALIDRPAFLAALASISAHLRGGHAAMAGPGWFVHLSSSLRYGVGVPVLAAGLAGFVFYGWRDRRLGLLFLVFPMAYYALIGAGETAFARYIIPVVPFLCLAAAYAVVEATRVVARWSRRPASATAFAWIAAAAAAAPSLVSAMHTDLLLSRIDSRLIAAQWIHDRYPDGVSIAQTGTVAGQVQMATAAHDTPERYPALAFEPESGRFFTPDGRDGSPQLIIVEQCPLAYCGVPDRWLTVIRDRYELDQTFVSYDESSPGLVYDRDDDFYLPLAGLSAVERPGPNITIYRRR
jgi:4-amino-4-deoxy-L-arabinose transferase-like glycosyltransferase